MLVPFALGVLLGCLAQTAQAVLQPPPLAWCVAGAGAVLTLATVMPVGRSGWARALVSMMGGATLAFGLADIRAHALSADRLAPALEGRVLEVEGTVTGLPVLYSNAVRFAFEVRHPAEAGLPSRISLNWYAPRAKAGEAQPERPQVHPGEVWRLSVRLKRPHGRLNPGGPETELTLFRKGIGATGTVSRAGAPSRLLGEVTSPGIWLARLRDHLRARLLTALSDAPAAGEIAALALGDQAAIAPADWDTYRRTGTAHLMSISGLHITLLAWIAWRLANWAWRQTARLPRQWCLDLPAPTVAAWSALAAATAYALLAGWGVPAQRTLLMLSTVLLLRQRGMRPHWADALALALVAVLLWDPWAVRQAGFWLSFVAVGMLFFAAPRQVAQAHDVAAGSEEGRAGRAASLTRRSMVRMGSALRDGARAQWVATVALAPLTLLFFQRVAVLSPLSNAVAIPVVTLAVAPLSIGGLLLPAPLDGWVWAVAAWAQQGLNEVLRTFAAWPLAQWHAAAPDGVSLALAALGMLALLVPWGWRLRLSGVLLLLPLLSNPGQRPDKGRFEVWFADVGQGMAVVVRTARHTLVYDTGPNPAPGADAGTRVLLPLLSYLGDRRVDMVVVSHDDRDHSGGAPALARALPDALLLTGAPPERARAYGFRRIDRCAAGQRWNWDGVEFSMHNPLGGETPPSDNASSCVLRVSSARSAVLLPGDIDAARELAMADSGRLPVADVLLVPHHGSRSSCSDALLDAVAPRLAVVQAGYRNHYGHPHPDVLAGYAARGIPVARTDRDGALRWNDAMPQTVVAWRHANARYWLTGTKVASDAGPQLASTQVPGSAPAACAEPESKTRR